MAISPENVSFLPVRQFFRLYPGEQPGAYEFRTVCADAFDQGGEFSPLERIAKASPRQAARVLEVQIEQARDATGGERALVYGVALIPLEALP